MLALMACGNDRATPPDDQPLPARVRLLTGTQYTNAVHDLLGEVDVPPLEMPGAPAHQFIYEEVLAVEAPLLVQYRIAAAQIGQQIAARPDPLGCASDRACQREGMIELVERALVSGAVDHCIEVGVLHPQFDQPTLGGMKIGVQGNSRQGRTGRFVR